MTRHKSVVLLSSGLDSTVNLYEAHARSEVIAVLTFDYGQRAAVREVAMARRACEALGLRHEVVRLPFFESFTRTALVDRQTEVPVRSQVSIDDPETSRRTAEVVWVPNRNGIFLNIAAGFAEGLGAKWIVPGFNIEEGATFADNTDAFLKAATAAFSFSTANHVEAVCFTTQMDKTAIVRRGFELGVKWEYVWSCYFGGEEPCGQCESCQRYARAFENARRSVSP